MKPENHAIVSLLLSRSSGLALHHYKKIYALAGAYSLCPAPANRTKLLSHLWR
jgi:hypothetical protein